MDRFVTTGRPACPLLQEARVIDIRDKNVTTAALLLKMASQTECLVAFCKHPLINGAMRRMAGHASFTQRLVLKNERPALRCMTLKASFVLAEQRHATAFERLWKAGAAALDG